MNKIVVIVIAALLGGGLLGAVMSGMIPFGGQRSAAKKADAVRQYSVDKDAKPPVAAAKVVKAPRLQPPHAPARPVDAKPKLDAQAGRRKLAKLWNEMPVATLAAIAKDWKDEELARVLVLMDNAKVAQLLEAIDTGQKSTRASKLSREIQRVASGS